MTDEEAIQQKHALTDLQQAFLMLKEETVQKDRRIEEREALLMRAVARHDERKRRPAKERHTRSTPPSLDGVKHTLKPQQKKCTPSGGPSEHQGHALPQAETTDELSTHRPEHGDMCQRLRNLAPR